MKLTAAAALAFTLFIPAAINRSTATEWVPIFQETANGMKVVHSIAVNAVSRDKDGILTAAGKVQLTHQSSVVALYTVNKLDCFNRSINIVADAGIGEDGEVVSRNSIAGQTGFRFTPQDGSGMNEFLIVAC